VNATIGRVHEGRPSYQKRRNLDEASRPGRSHRRRTARKRRGPWFLVLGEKGRGCLGRQRMGGGVLTLRRVFCIFPIARISSGKRTLDEYRGWKPAGLHNRRQKQKRLRNNHMEIGKSPRPCPWARRGKTGPSRKGADDLESKKEVQKESCLWRSMALTQNLGERVPGPAPFNLREREKRVRGRRNIPA